MTDARFPDRWLTDRRLQRLSDSHFRSFITSLAWSVSNRTDGIIEPGDLELIPNFAVGAPKALMDAGLWAPERVGWRIADFSSTQTTAAVLRALEDKREKERLKKAQQRAKGSQADRDSTDLDVTGDVPGDIQGDVSGGHKGQASSRQAQGHGEAALRLAAGTEWRGPGPNPYIEHK